MSHSEYVGALIVPVVRPSVGWELPEETMPTSELHTHVVDLLFQLLRAWAGKSGARIVADLAIRWVPEDARIGVDPDVAVLLPSPPVEALELVSVRTWEEGHEPPLLAIEVVSDSNPHKDYSIAPLKYAASGTKELWIFDPRLSGPNGFGGPFRLQIYRRDESNRFVRIYEGEGPAYSPALNAYAVVTDEGRMLRIANDDAATEFWLTTEEAATAKSAAAIAKAEAATAKAEAATAKAEAALAELAALKAELAKRGG